jgi:hypothetical protein
MGLDGFAGEERRAKGATPRFKARAHALLTVQKPPPPPARERLMRR